MFKKNTAVTGFIVGLVSKTDGSDITTGTPVGYYTLDGGTQTAIGDVTPTHEGNGEWSFDLLAAEMNGNVVGLTFTHTSAITVHFTIKTDTKVVSELNDAITAPTAVQNRAEMDSNSTRLSTIAGDVVNIDGIVPAAAGSLMGLANGAITALKFGAGAIDAAATSTDFVDEIVNGVLDETLTSHATADSLAVAIKDSLADTDELQSDNVPGLIAGLDDLDAAGIRSAIGLATANLDTQLAALPTAVENRAEMDSNSTQLAAIAAFNNISAADVLTQVNAALDTVISELGIGTPATTPTIRTALMLLYMSLLNKQDTTGSSNEIHNAAGTVIADAVLADDGAVFSKAKYIAP